MDEFFKAWERRAVGTAIAVTALSLIVSAPLIAASLGTGALWLIVTLSSLVAALVYRAMTRKVRRRRFLVSQPFPPEWEAVLQKDVVFYRVLDPAERDRFRRLLQVFIGEKRITGIKVDLDITTIVLTAVSATIPIFGFPGWEWGQINEILIYPERFDEDFSYGKPRDHATLGMVGSGPMNGLMILSKPDLIDGFRNPADKRNVGLHEFTHLLDKSDGIVDGVPSVVINRGSVEPWIRLMHRTMKEIEAGKSDINPYALTNDAEFFAVVSEYFFERPGVMQQKHPGLYSALERVFNQNLSAHIGAFRREISIERQTFGRNSPCPCGSGLKFKKCCLR